MTTQILRCFIILKGVDKMDIVKAKKAMETTPEHKAYIEACEAVKEAWDAVKETSEYKDYDETWKAYKEACEAYRETLKCEFASEALRTGFTFGIVQDALEATPQWKVYKEAGEAADEAWEAWAATPEFKDYLKVVKTYEAACKKQHGERDE